MKKLSNIFSKDKNIEIKWDAHYLEDVIKLIPDKSLEGFSEIKNLILTYEISLDEDGSILLPYEEIYDLYYDEYNNAVDIYKNFNLPDIFNGILEVENKNNFLVDEEVIYQFRFSGDDGESYNLLHGNILSSNLKDECRLMSKELFSLIKVLKDYNKTKDKRSDEACQFEMLKIIKDYAENIDIKLNERIRKEEMPIIIDSLKIDFKDDGETIEIFPRFNEDDSINDSILKEIDSFEKIKGSYNADINGTRRRYVIKHKDTLEKIVKNKINRGEKRLEILSGKSELFQDENIDISAFGPRVTGLGYLTYKSSSSTVRTNDLDWLYDNAELPFIQGTNINGDYENITLTPDHMKLLKDKMVELNESGVNEGEVEFKTDKGNPIKMIMNREEIKNEIKNIESRIKSPFDLRKVSDIESILKICDRYEDQSYIPYKGIYIKKELRDIKDELRDQLENIKSKMKPDEKGKSKVLLIAENLDDEEYKEDETVKKLEREVEIPDTFRPNIKLFPYQQDCLKKLQDVYLSSRINGFLLCDDMGLGKTLQLLSFLSWLKERNELKPALIVAPNSLLNNWDSEPDGEIQKFFNNNYFETYRIVGRIDSSVVEEIKNKDIVFTTYDSLRMNNITLGKVNWSVMICDEAQKIKNPKTLVTVAAKAQNADFKIICSATPIENSLEELWTLVDFSKPGLLGSLKEFKECYVKKSAATSEDLQRTNDDLYDKIKDFYIRREKSILPKTLPKKNIKLYYVKPSTEEINILERIRDTEDFTISAIQKMLAICSHVDMINGSIPTETNVDYLISRSSKIGALKDILSDIKEKDEKVIIFTRLRKVQKIIYFAIKKWFNMEPYIVNGQDGNLDARTAKINEFRKSKDFNVIILSPEVAGFGITITEANHVIHYTRLWNPAKEDQATDRVYRIGQTKDVTVHYPILSFSKEGIREYDNVNKYVEENISVGNYSLSPEEKLNVLLARKKEMLLKFFLSAGSGDFSTSDFKNLGETVKKDAIRIDNNFNNIITPFEFETLTAVLYEKMGFTTHLTARSNDKGVDVIALKDDKILFIQCKHTLNKVGTDAMKDLLYAKDIYKEYVDLNRVECVIVTSSNEVHEAILSSDISVVKRDKLANMLCEYSIYKDEVDVKDDNRCSFENVLRIIGNGM